MFTDRNKDILDMHSFLHNSFNYKPLIIATAALAITLPAMADDIDVFNAVLSSQNKPNILFVLDPAIPIGTVTNADVIAALLSRINPSSNTATVNALTHVVLV